MISYKNLEFINFIAKMKPFVAKDNFQTKQKKRGTMTTKAFTKLGLTALTLLGTAVTAHATSQPAITEATVTPSPASVVTPPLATSSTSVATLKPKPRPRSIIPHTTSADTVLEPGREVVLPPFSSGEPGAEGKTPMARHVAAAHQGTNSSSGVKVSEPGRTSTPNQVPASKTEPSSPSSTLLEDIRRSKHKLSLRNVYVRAGAGWTMYDRFKTVKGNDVPVIGSRASYYSKSPKYAPVYTVGIGYKFTDSVRADVNFYYGVVDYKLHDSERKLSQRTKSSSAMLNAYYYFPEQGKLSYYITAGGGIGKNRVGDLTDTKDPTDTVTYKGINKQGFVWNAGAGVNINLLRNVAVDLGYRYVNLGAVAVKERDSTFGGAGSQKIKGHQGAVSVIYSFI